MDIRCISGKHCSTVRLACQNNFIRWYYTTDYIFYTFIERHYKPDSILSSNLAFLNLYMIKKFDLSLGDFGVNKERNQCRIKIIKTSDDILFTPEVRNNFIERQGKVVNNSLTCLQPYEINDEKSNLEENKTFFNALLKTHTNYDFYKTDNNYSCEK